MEEKSKELAHKAVSCWNGVYSNVRPSWAVGTGDFGENHILTLFSTMRAYIERDVLTGKSRNIKGLAQYCRYDWDSGHFEGGWFIDTVYNLATAKTLSWRAEVYCLRYVAFLSPPPKITNEKLLSFLFSKNDKSWTWGHASLIWI